MPVDEIETLPRLEGGRMLAITSMMAQAFEFDPMQEWLFPDRRSRVRRLQTFFERDVIHRLNGHAEPDCIDHHAVAFWHPPNQGDGLDVRSALRILPAFASVVAHHPVRAPKVLRAVRQHRPHEPHWYLSHLAVARRRQGVGLGKRLMSAGMVRAEHDGVGLYLETANPANLPFYGALGFAQVGVVKVGDAPHVYLLWWHPGRAPRPSTT
jgi:ribosomal protein S18 acetylase RimI-like enzyme